MEDSMAPRAFVTGATGLLGSNLVRALVAAGYEVRALARSVDKARRQLGDVRVEVVAGDLGDVDAFADALRGVDVLFHTAAYFRDGYKGGRHWDAMRRINVDGTRALVSAAYARGVRRVVHTSSVAVVRETAPGRAIDETMARPAETEPDDYYRSKILSDRVVDELLATHPDLWACFVLPGFMNGPGDAGPTSAGQFVMDFVARRLPGVLDTSFSYVDARDVAAAMVAAAERGRRGERYLVAGRTLHVREAMAELEAVTGVRAPRRALPIFVIAAIALLNELWARLSGRPVLLSWAGYRAIRREGTKMRFDSTKAERELGVAFRPIRATLADAVDWFVSAGMVPPPPPRPLRAREPARAASQT
jgi:dihydroflavonol-4-reductase